MSPRCGVAGDLGDGGSEVSIVFSSSSDNKPKSEVTWGATAGALISRSGRPFVLSWVLRALGAQAAGREVAVDQQVTPDDAWSKP